jgi:hypothetical protein
MTKYFVWIAGLRGPEAQFWDDDKKTADGKPVKTLTKPMPVPDNTGLAQCSAENPIKINEAEK